jgi:hypothetical protein
MKLNSIRVVALVFAAVTLLFVGAGTASAQVGISVGIGGPPLPPEHRWHAPYRNAYWIRGHNEWRGGRWVYVGGYYGYPPYAGAVWIEGRRGRDGFWHPGHWRR